jgi:GDPmannose 4,6-dehydratase
MKKALITGITGQDGSYLAEFLLEKGYEVYGAYRRGSTDGHFERISHLGGKIHLVCLDLTDFESIKKIIKEVLPDEVYNLAAQSHVGISFSQKSFTEEVNWKGVERILDCLKKYSPSSKIYQASTSELFGEVLETPQSEKTSFNPVSPYAVAKQRAHEAIAAARDSGVFACAGILFNHESPRRGKEFVTRKISEGLARIKLGIPQAETNNSFLEIGNLKSKRDWGYAKDYVEAMWLMLQQEKPKDYVISTGEAHSVKEFIEAAADALGIQINWKGEGISEEGFDQNGKKIIGINPKFFRPREVNFLLGDCSRAKKELGWEPKVKFRELVKMMVEEDLARLKKEFGKE